MQSISTASLSLILLLFCAGLAGCGKTGVDDPLVWFQKNKNQLATIVQDLARTEIGAVWPENNKSLYDKLSHADKEIYDRVQRFIINEEIKSVTVVRSEKTTAKPLEAVSFHVQENSKFADLTEVDIIYVEEGVKPELFFYDVSCLDLDARHWFACTWKSR